MVSFIHEIQPEIFKYHRSKDSNGLRQNAVLICAAHHTQTGVWTAIAFVKRH